MANSYKSMFLLAIIIAASILASPVLAKEIYVGDSFGCGWCPFLKPFQWCLKKLICVGDILHFLTPWPFLPIPVYLVSLGAYKTCNVSKAFWSGTNGNSSFPCLKPGVYYFIGDALNCRSGLRLNITILPMPRCKCQIIVPPPSGMPAPPSGAPAPPSGAPTPPSGSPKPPQLALEPALPLATDSLM